MGCLEAKLVSCWACIDLHRSFHKACVSAQRTFQFPTTCRASPRSDIIEYYNVWGTLNSMWVDHLSGSSTHASNKVQSTVSCISACAVLVDVAVGGLGAIGFVMAVNTTHSNK